MSRFWNYAGSSLIGLAAACGPNTASKNSIQTFEVDSEQFVKDNLRTIIAHHEEILGVEFPEEVPDIEFHFMITKGKDKFGGLYLYDINEIYLANNLLYQETGGLSVFVARHFTYGLTPEGKRTLDHELGHFYCDKLSESLGKGSWPNSDNISEKTFIGTELVAEGIAEYFERKINGGADKFTDEEWPEDPANFFALNQYVIYEGGYHLVKPIIDRHGQKAIEYLMFNPPTGNEVYNIPEYQKKVMKELSQKIIKK